MNQAVDKLSLAARIAESIGSIQGVDGVVLGGSLATGTAHEGSDIDIGIYYHKELFDEPSLTAVATALDDTHRKDVVVPAGAWGPWINGGGWLTVDGVAVDLLLRDTARVRKVIRQCRSGIITIDYQCGHPFGFVNSIYMGEVAYCKPLYSTVKLQQLKALTDDCPKSYRKAATEKFLWEADFSLLCGRKAVAKKDTLYAAGSLFRSAIALAQVVYSLNGMYILNEKGCIHRLAESGTAVMPEGFAEDMMRVMTLLSPDTIEPCFDLLQRQLTLTKELCEGKIWVEE